MIIFPRFLPPFLAKTAHRWGFFTHSQPRSPASSPSSPPSSRPNPLAALAALDALPPHLATAALTHALPAANPALFPLLAQRWLALNSTPLPAPSRFALLPFGRFTTPSSSVSPANSAWQSIVLRWSELPEPIRQAFHTQATPSLQFAATQTLSSSSNISALLPFLVAAAEPPLRLLALNKFAKAFEADPQSLAALTHSAAADFDQPALAAAARGVIHHHSITPVEIALALADRRTLRTGGALADWLAAEAAVGAGSIRAAIRRSKDDTAWVRALELVSTPAWKSAALQKLTSQPNPIQFSELLAAGHLLENPHRAASIRSALRTKPIEASLPTASRRLIGSGAIRWATLKARLPEALSQRVALDALARLAAARLRTPLTTEPETDPRVIQTKFLNLSPAGTLHECTRAAARTPLQSANVPSLIAPPTFQHWNNEDAQLTVQDGTLARIRWRRLIENDRDHAIRELRTVCERVPLANVVSQITLVRRLEVVPELVGWLAALAIKPIGDNHRAVATAVAALGDADGAAIRKLLGSLTTHSDARIRANAIESLGRLIRRGDRDAARLIELKPDPNHRVRANAIRSLWFEETRCSDALLEMLADDRLSHRIAIAWSCRRLPLSTMHTAALRRHLSSEQEPRIRELLADALVQTDRHRRLSWRTAIPEPTPKLAALRLAVA